MKFTARTSVGHWIDRVESIFPARCADMRRTLFLDACDVSGLSQEHRLVQVLAADLQFIRPEDVWLRILASGRENGFSWEVGTRLDAALSALRVVDAYACRHTAAPVLIEKLIDVPATMIDRSDKAICEWRQFHLDGLAGRGRCLNDSAGTGSGFTRFTPFAVATAVCASEYQTAEQVVSVGSELAALEWLSQQLLAWVRGDGRKLGFAARWLNVSPADSEFNGVLSEVNGIAEQLVTHWRDAEPFVDPAWSALIDEQVWDSIRFAAIAASAAEMKSR